MSVIKVENLSKQYRLGVINSSSFIGDMGALFQRVGLRKVAPRKDETFWALKEINFEVQQGDVLGIIGKNGAGKSTLLKILSKVTSPSSGSIKVKGRIASLLEVGTGFHPDLTGRENIFMNGAILGMTKKEIRSKFDEIVDFAGIELFIDTPVKRYSSGMYVRLAFAVAAHLEPEILIIDEVLAVGDAEFQKKCLGKMKDIAGHGRTVLFVSHNMAAVSNLCNNVIYLNNGAIQNSGPTDQIIYNYLNSSENSNNSNNLNTLKDREGNGKVLFENIFIIDEKGNRLTNVHSGQNIFIELHFSSNSYIDRLYFSIDIKNSEDLSLLHFDNIVTDRIEYKIKRTVEKGVVRCFVPKLPLPAGSYKLDLFCSDTQDVFDSIKNAFTLTVEAGDYFGSGFDLTSRYCLVLADHSWKLTI
jgi:lipopolysaccharide transport system ATP-binding protein